MKKLNSIFVVFLLVTSIVSGSGIIYFVLSAEQVVLSVEPQTVSVEPDQVFTLSVHVDNVENLYKWRLSISWDPAVMELEPASISAIAEGSFLQEAGRTVFHPESYVAGSGYLSYISCRLVQLTGSSGSGTLLTLCFKAVGDGETSITISNSILYNHHTQKISHTLKEGHVSVRSTNHDVGVSLEAPAQLVLNNWVLLNATVQNLGDVDETNVNLAILVNGVVKEERTDSLPIGGSYSMCFNWTPSYKGVYTIAAKATPLPGETKTDNNYLESPVEVISLSHDVAVSLQCPTRLILGESTELIAIATNVGTFSETNVEVTILINSEIVKSETIELLTEGTPKQVTYGWKPVTEGTYNVAAYVQPVPEETNVINNIDSKSVDVVIPSAEPAILIVADDDGSYFRNGTSLHEFELALQSAGYNYEVWKESVGGRPSLEVLLEYKLVIWTCGDYASYAVDRYDAEALEQYLNHGGNIILEGGNIGYNHGHDDFMTNVAHAHVKMHKTRSPSLTVVGPEHPVVRNLLPNLTWVIPPRFDDGVHPVNGGFAVINYTDTSFSERYDGPWTAVTVFDGTQIGVGSVLYYSFVLRDLPENQKEILAANSVEWLTRFGLSVVIDKIIHANTESVYFIYSDPSFATFDVAVGATIFTYCENPQHQGFTDTGNWLTSMGEINSTEIWNTTIVVLGNSLNHITTNYYESSELTPISLSENSTCFLFLNSLGETVGALAKGALESGHQDMFAIQAFKDQGNNFLIIYGVGWKGTWAASMYLANALLKNLREYSDAYYVFCWTDDGMQDAIPQVSEIHKVSSG